MNLTNFLSKGISYDAEYKKLANQGMEAVMKLGEGSLPPELEVKIFSLASDSAKMLVNLLRSKEAVTEYYDLVESFSVSNKTPNELAIGLTQELSTLPEADVKENNLGNICYLSLSLLDSLTKQDYMTTFKRLVSLSKSHDKSYYK